LLLGYASGSNGTYNLSGGSLSVTGSETIGLGGTGVFNQSGGTNSVGGTMTISANPATSSGTYNLSGGNLTVTNGIINNGAFNYSGGTITGALQNNGLVNVTGGTSITPNTFAASVMNNSGAYFTVGNGVNSAYVTFTNAVTNNTGATFTINNSYVTFLSNFINQGAFVTDPSTVIFDGVFTSNGGTITGSTGDTYEFLASGVNTIDLGGNNLDIGTLVLGQGATLNITDGSLTVATLIDPTGSDSGITGAFTADSYGTLNTTSAPEPGTILLLGIGLAGLIGLKRKRIFG
jgi:hypothetical protein